MRLIDNLIYVIMVCSLVIAKEKKYARNSYKIIAKGRNIECQKHILIKFIMLCKSFWMK